MSVKDTGQSYYSEGLKLFKYNLDSCRLGVLIKGECLLLKF